MRFFSSNTLASIRVVQLVEVLGVSQIVKFRVNKVFFKMSLITLLTDDFDEFGTRSYIPDYF